MGKVLYAIVVFFKGCLYGLCACVLFYLTLRVLLLDAEAYEVIKSEDNLHIDPHGADGLQQGVFYG